MKNPTRKSAMPPRRNSYQAEIEPTAEGASIRRAKFGRESPEAVELFGLIQQIRDETDTDKRQRLEAHLSSLMVRAVSNNRADVFEGMARLTRAGTAHPAIMEALKWRDEAEQFFAQGIGPKYTREEVVAAIQRATKCSERTAQRATVFAGLKRLFQWRSGRPKR